MLYLLLSNVVVAIVLAVGVWALLHLGWANRWHHLWLGLLGFAFVIPNTLDIVIRGIAILVAADDAVQHLIQWREWQRLHKGQIVWPSVPDEGTGWPGIYRSPLHQLYWFVVEHL